MLSNWAQVFGEEAISPRRYGKGLLLGNDIRVDFVNSYLSKLNVEDWDFSPASSNTSISRLQGLLLRLINTYMNRYTREEGYNADRLALLQRVVRDEALSIGKISPERTGEIYEIFNDSNRRLFEKYFDVNENLFERSSIGSSVGDTTIQIDNTQEEALLECLVELLHAVRLEEPYTPTVRLEAPTVDFFRDLAFKYERNEPLEKEDALRLMRLARRGRPDGFYINQFIERHQDSD
jgi:hypothetical protein